MRKDYRYGIVKGAIQPTGYIPFDEAGSPYTQVDFFHESPKERSGVVYFITSEDGELLDGYDEHGPDPADWTGSRLGSMEPGTVRHADSFDWWRADDKEIVDTDWNGYEFSADESWGLSADATLAAWKSAADDGIYVGDPTAMASSTLVEAATTTASPTISPNGSHYAYWREQGGTEKVFVDGVAVRDAAYYGQIFNWAQLYLTNTKIYWLELADDPDSTPDPYQFEWKMRRADLDGTNMEVLFTLTSTEDFIGRTLGPIGLSGASDRFYFFWSPTTGLTGVAQQHIWSVDDSWGDLRHEVGPRYALSNGLRGGDIGSDDNVWFDDNLKTTGEITRWIAMLETAPTGGGAPTGGWGWGGRWGSEQTL